MKGHKNEYELDKLNNKNHVATPRYVVEDIYNMIDIKSFNKCWFPFNNYDSNFKLKADELKLNYLATHIFDDCGNDFIKILPPDGTDLMISNPPFNIQNEIILRSFWLIKNGYIKSFALLLPISTFETETRGRIYNENKDKLSIIYMKKRIKFIGHTQTFNKGCCWVCYNIPTLKGEKICWI